MAKFFKIPFAATGDVLPVPDAAQPDGSVSYAQGFGPDYQRKTDGTDPLAKTVPRDSTNALFNDLTGAVGEIQLNGVPAWQSVGAPYPINAVVRYNNKNWISQITNNNDTPVEGASWSEQPASSYTKDQVDTKLALKANASTTLSGYGINDAYTKTEGDARYLRTANNLSDVSSKSAARSNLELGTASTADITTSATDSTSGRVTKNGDWGIGGLSQAPTISDFKTLAPGGIYRGTFNAAANGPVSTSVGFVAIAKWHTSTILQWQVETQSVTYTGYYNSTSGAISWVEGYSKGNTSSSIQALLAASDNQSARLSLGVPAGADKQMVTAWVNFQGTGTVGIRDSLNISSITDRGAGSYTANFSTPMSAATYAVAGSGGQTGSAANNPTQGPCAVDYTVSGFDIYTGSDTTAKVDWLWVSLVVLGGK